MATREQCEERLREILTTRKALIEFTKEWGGGYNDNVGPTDKEFIDANIRRIVDDAHRKNLLDLLSTRIGLQTDAEQARRDVVSARRRSSLALLISGFAALLALVSLLRGC